MFSGGGNGIQQRSQSCREIDLPFLVERQNTSAGKCCQGNPEQAAHKSIKELVEPLAAGLRKMRQDNPWASVQLDFLINSAGTHIRR